MRLIRVDDRKTIKKFHQVQGVIYKNDPVWVCPLCNEIEAIFDPESNPYYRHGEAERWILTDDEGNLTGRLAAFIDRNMANSYEQPTGGMGFFECINDKTSAFLLFDTAREWLIHRGMEAMDGPINFGETDKYWGLLVGGFTHPSFDVPYNPPYYEELFEAYGFGVYYNMEGFHIDLKAPYPDRFLKIANWVAAKPGYEFRHFTWKEQDKFVNDFAEVYNQAWASFKKYFEPIEPDYIKSVLLKSKPIIDEEFLWYAYQYGKPVAIYMMFPDLNQILKHLNGKLDLLSMIKFLYYKRRKTITRAKGLIMGMIPKYQNHGIESVFILNLRKVLEKKPQYTEVELSWVADYNPKMRKIFVAVGGVPAKKYKLYRYLFDRNKEFKRHPMALYLTGEDPVTSGEN